MDRVSDYLKQGGKETELKTDIGACTNYRAGTQGNEPGSTNISLLSCLLETVLGF